MTENIARFPDLGKDITNIIIRSAMDVHKELGPGLLESVYEECLLYELKNAGIDVKRQKHIPIIYKGATLETGLKIDLYVDNHIIIELKAVDRLLPIHEAQLLTYMKLSKSPLGLLINFNEILLKNGIKRLALSNET